MQESVQSIQLMQFNKQYLDLYYSKYVQKSLHKKNLLLYIKLLIIFLKNKRYKEFLGIINRRFGKREQLQTPIGRWFQEDLNTDYRENYRVIVYTALFGSRTPINNPMYMNPCYKYIIFTDQDLPKGCLWERRAVPKEMPKDLSDAGKNRWLKLHPHRLFSEYDFSVYIDGGIILMADVLPYVAGMGDSFFATHMMSAPVDCVYESAKTVISAKKAPKELLLRQMEYYKKQGYPEHYGMYENGFLVRKHMDVKCMKIMDDWWEQLEIFTKRDQMSLGYVLWKNHIKDDDILILGNNIFRNYRFRFYDMKL